MINQSKNLTDEELLIEISRRARGKKGLPISLTCFYCKQSFWSKWNNATQAHSKLNDLFYWTEQKRYQYKHVCNSCLRKFYLERNKDFVVLLKVSGKYKHLMAYVHRGVV